MKFIVHKTLFCFLGLALFVAGTAHAASCEGAYISRIKEMKKFNNDAAAFGLTAVGVATTALPAQYSVTAGVAGVVVSHATEQKPEDMQEMLALLQDVRIGDGVALYSLIKKVQETNPFTSRSEIIDIVKMTDEKGFLCIGEYPATIEDLAMYIITETSKSYYNGLLDQLDRK